MGMSVAESVDDVAGVYLVIFTAANYSVLNTLNFIVV